MSARKKEETAATQEWRPEIEWRPCFTFMRDWFDCIDELPEETQGRLYRALVRFGLNFTEPELTDPTEKFCWKALRNQALYGWKKYAAGKGTKEGKQRRKEMRDAFPDKAKEPDGIDWKEDAF